MQHADMLTNLRALWNYTRKKIVVHVQSLLYFVDIEALKDETEERPRQTV